jgi:CRP-like cAMP-binding protein
MTSDVTSAGQPAPTNRGNASAATLVHPCMSIFANDLKQQELRRIPLFATLPRRELKLLARTADLVDVPAGKELIHEGETGREFFAIAEGEVEISQNGKPIATEQAGEFFGEIALLHDVPRTATVTATTPSSLFVLTAQAFRSILASRFDSPKPA